MHAVQPARGDPGGREPPPRCVSHVSVRRQLPVRSRPAPATGAHTPGTSCGALNRSTHLCSSLSYASHGPSPPLAPPISASKRPRPPRARRRCPGHSRAKMKLATCLVVLVALAGVVRAWPRCLRRTPLGPPHRPLPRGAPPQRLTLLPHPPPAARRRGWPRPPRRAPPARAAGQHPGHFQAGRGPRRRCDSAPRRRRHKGAAALLLLQHHNPGFTSSRSAACTCRLLHPTNPFSYLPDICPCCAPAAPAAAAPLTPLLHMCPHPSQTHQPPGREWRCRRCDLPPRAGSQQGHQQRHR